jgi:hypothetical protein
VGRHLLDGRRQAVLMALRSEWEDAALSIVVTVGAYVVDRHAPLNLGETVRIPHELKTPTEKVVVASADELVTGLGLCADYDPPVEILWLVPQTRDRFTLTSL